MSVDSHVIASNQSNVIQRLWTQEVSMQGARDGGAYTGACSMTMTHGVAVRLRFVDISAMNLRSATR